MIRSTFLVLGAPHPITVAPAILKDTADLAGPRGPAIKFPSIVCRVCSHGAHFFP